MKTIKLLLVLFLSLSCGRAWAQTNTPTATPVEQVLNVDSDSGYYDGITNQMVYLGHVVVVYNMKDTLNCERLTVDIPADHGNPTNIVAETNVVVDVLDEKGGTNHITAGRAVYTYQLLNPATNVVNNVTNVVYAATNEIVTFTLGNPRPKVERPDATVSC
ncbi:MAG TPA: LptA/OstA family protein, partial [Verrucomicrobiae bacterium]|nr:LptA/OstA family protein [Verrucomicrobiae bacterium]